MLVRPVNLLAPVVGRQPSLAHVRDATSSALQTAASCRRGPALPVERRVLPARVGLVSLLLLPAVPNSRSDAVPPLSIQMEACCKPRLTLALRWSRKRPNGRPVGKRVSHTEAVLDCRPPWAMSTRRRLLVPSCLSGLAGHPVVRWSAARNSVM